MRVLVLSFYFPPDLSAGSFRTAALVKALASRGSADITIDVVASSPNRYANAELADIEDDWGAHVAVERISVPQHKSGVADQVKAFSHFARGAFKATSGKDYDVVFATSSRLFTASLGAAISVRCKAPLYLDIRDIFTETMQDVFAGSPLTLGMPAISVLERLTLGRAQTVNVVSPAFIEYFTERYKPQNFSTYTNGVDDLFIDALPISHSAPEGGRPVVLAAGNIGEGQGLHHIVPGLATRLPNVDFRFLGAGGRTPQLRAAVDAAGVTNVEIVDPKPRAELIAEYSKATVLFTHLNDLPVFDRVLPSKLFEYAATGLPILAGVKGFSRTFLQDEVEGAAVFDPCDADGAERALQSLLSGTRVFDRSDFIAKYNRNAIMDQMADDIIKAGRS